MQEVRGSNPGAAPPTLELISPIPCLQVAKMCQGSQKGWCTRKPSTRDDKKNNKYFVQKEGTGGAPSVLTTNCSIGFKTRLESFSDLFGPFIFFDRYKSKRGVCFRRFLLPKQILLAGGTISSTGALQPIPPVEIIQIPPNFLVLEIDSKVG